MFSIRAVARILPRSAPRLSSHTTRTISRPSIVSSLRAGVPRIQPASAAAFSTSGVRRDDTAQELGAKLGNELALEQENTEASLDSDNNVQAFLTQNDFWTLTSKDGEQDVTLTRKYDDEDITVAFSIADFNTPSMMPDEEVDEAFMDEEEDVESAQSGGANTKGAINQGRTSANNIKVAPEDSIAPADREGLRDEEDDDYDSQQAFPANVNVLIQRPGKGALRTSLVADNGKWTINSVTHLPSSVTTSQSAEQLLSQDPDVLYTGPPFQQLDEEVQTLLEQYLEARGIDTGLALFVPDYIDVKEQKEYQGWLERVKEFVE